MTFDTGFALCVRSLYPSRRKSQDTGQDVLDLCLVLITVVFFIDGTKYQRCAGAIIYDKCRIKNKPVTWTGTGLKRNRRGESCDYKPRTALSLLYPFLLKGIFVPFRSRAI